MADAKHLARLKQGVSVWNAWRRRSPSVRPDLSRAFLIEAELRGINLSNANLERANLRSSTLSRANLMRANLRGADLRAASLRRARLDHADLTGAVLRYTSLAEAGIEGAILTGCQIYGTSAWNLRGTPRDQSNLVIRANPQDPAVSVDDLEIAQFVYLLLHNDKIRNVIETVGKKAVLILGRFTAERKAVLDAVRELLRRRGYVAMLFDFAPSRRRDLTETIVALAHMSRFVIADLTDPRSIPQEVTSIIPGLPSVPVLPVVLAAQPEYPMFEHWRRYPWVLPLFKYKDQTHLLQRLEGSLIARAERKARQQTGV
jgi:pentapeptide repeat protein